MLRTARRILENRLEVLQNVKRELDGQLREAESALVCQKHRYDALAQHWQRAAPESVLTADDRRLAQRRLWDAFTKAFAVGFGLPLTVAAVLSLIAG